MKYVNATVGCYQSATLVDGKVLSLNYPFDRIIASVDDEGKISIKDFVVFTHINLLGTNDENNRKLCVLENEDVLWVKIRLTKCDRDEDKQRYIDLDSFVIDPYSAQNKQDVHRACFPYFNYKRVTKIDSISLPLGAGPYVIKVLVQRGSGEKENPIVQSMNYLCVLNDK